MERVSSRAVVSGGIVFAVSFILTAGFNFYSGLKPDFILATLIAFAFLFGFFEMVFFSLLSVLFLNWQLSFRFELVFLFLISLLIFWSRKFLPTQSWAVGMVLVMATFLFYFIGNSNIFSGNVFQVLVVSLLNLIYGLAIFWSLKKLFEN